MYGFKFSLEGDFAHFRDPTTQQVLETFIGPPRSSIIGLLGASIGQPRDEIKELSEKLEIGLIIKDLNGKRRETVNLHNLKSSNLKVEAQSEYAFEFLNNNAITPTLRISLVNPRYSVAVFSENKELLEKINNRIKKPEFPLYLGISEYLAWTNNITDIKKLEPKRDSRFKCFMPDPGEFVSYIKQGYSVKPSIHQTPRSTYAENGKRKADFIDLLMLYNSEVELQNKKDYYEIEEEKFIAF